MMKKGDKILIIVVLLLIGLGLGYRYHNVMVNKDVKGIAYVEVDGRLYGKYDLSKVGDKEIKLDLPNNEISIIEFKDKKIRVKDANCPDRICVKTGWISNSGEIIVCLPYNIIIKILGERQDVDINAY